MRTDRVVAYFDIQACPSGQATIFLNVLLRTLGQKR
jgi:hypothetical protein